MISVNDLNTLKILAEVQANLILEVPYFYVLIKLMEIQQ